MKGTLQFTQNMSAEDVHKAGFEYVECELKDYAMLAKQNCRISGVVVRLSELDMNALLGLVADDNLTEVPYILIDTMGCQDVKLFYDFLENAADVLKDYSGKIYLENGAIGTDITGYSYGPYSEIRDIAALCKHGNSLCEKDCFKLAISIGVGNLLEKNVSAMIIEAGDGLELLHMSDNDGRYNLKQMPYTFTTGRGIWSTDWNRILGALMKIGFDGFISFDTVGLFERVPNQLQFPMMKLEKAIFDRWDRQFRYEELVLNIPGKKIILFGAGAMAANFIEVWGGKYKPEFMVDNNSKNWGKVLGGIEVKDPKEILSVPEEERQVIICNMHYNEIKMQLTSMGVKYNCYNDEFYSLI